MIAEQLTGETVGEAITERLITPLGLTGMSYPTTAEMPDSHSRGYATDLDRTGIRDVTRHNPALAAGAGAMISTLADLRTAARALAEGSLLSPAMQQERLTWQPLANGAGLRYGLGLMEIGGFVGHGGNILGYSSWMLYLPEADATVVVLTNRVDLGKEAVTPATSMGILFDIMTLLFPDRLGS